MSGLARFSFALYLAVLCHFAIAAPAFLSRDVVVIGGGSSGTYTAIQLQKHGKSVALIERKNRLGGNVDTYRDPTSGQTYDNGVLVFDNISVVTDYFDHFDIPLANGETSGGVNLFANFDNGKLVSPNKTYAGDEDVAFSAYLNQLAKYPYLTNGFNLPSPVPEDLLLPWGDFIKKYKLEAFAYTVSMYNQGVGNILDVPTLYMLKYLNRGEVVAIQTNNLLTTKDHNNQQLYDKALAQLGSSAFLSSNVERVTRTEEGVEVGVSTPSGFQVIRAKRLVIAIRPTLAALQPFLDLSIIEAELFGKFGYIHYWCGLVGNTGFPANTSICNADPNAPYAIPQFPGAYWFDATGLTGGLHNVFYSSPYYQSDEEARGNVLAAVSRLQQSLGYAMPNGEPEILHWNAHLPFFLTVPVDDIRAGFYGRLEALQGESGTYWTGAAWQSEDSSMLWNYTETMILPRLLADLGGSL